MLHVYVTFRDRSVGHFELPGDRVRIGRHPDNEVQIDSMAVSRHHCLLERAGEGWVVEDLGSNNGTLVNGAAIRQRTPVREGDVLSIGKFQVSFRLGPAGDGAPSGRVRAREDGRTPEAREQAASLKGFLILRNRPGPPVLLERDALVLGAAPGADLPVAGAPRLAVIVRGHGGFQVLDVGPTPGAAVRVAGRPVTVRAWLADGDVLAVGDLEAEFHVGTPQGDEPTMTIQAPPGGFGPA
ncbi:MAG: FHA domain-containing protein [Planctomycetes bacterium]|nr:FHA domain-containing protein [Planctomycetota bacterium]